MERRSSSLKTPQGLLKSLCVVTTDGHCLTSGGRVLAVVAQADTFDNAFERAYTGLAQVTYEGMTFRRDIGHQVRSR